MPTERGESQPLRGLHTLAPFAWKVLVTAVVCLAVYLALGRFAMSQVPVFANALLGQINHRLPFEVSVDRLTGSWSAFSPELHFDRLLIRQADAAAPPIVLGRGSLRLDLPASLRTGTLQLSRLDLAGLSLDARLTDQLTIELLGFTGGSGEALRAWLEGFLPNVERVSLSDHRVRLAIGDQTLDLQLNLLLEREGNARRLQGRIIGDSLSLALNAEGVGSPLRPRSWTGDMYVDVQSGDLGALSTFWKSLDWPFRLSGSAAAEFWLSRVAGESQAHMRWTSEGLQIDERDGGWSLPVDALSFEAVLDQRARHWSLLTEDFHIERAGKALDLDRAQFDWWGQAMRIRATDLGLAALPSILEAAPGLPAGLRTALPELSPRGTLRAIELRLDDLAHPAQSWQLRSLIDDLAIESWRNAPALTGVSGFLELSPGSGLLQLDSGLFSMHFPAVYREALAYSEALGDLRLSWNPDGLHISSGLMQLRGDEGDIRGLVAVDVPFSERVTGVELELLLGMQDSDLRFRHKYLPYKLPTPLLEWLTSGIVSGAVQRAGFIWRGSVLPGNEPHMSAQLFMDAADATLRYDPAWPVLENIDATVWIDDRRAWARAARAKSVGLTSDNLMVRVLPLSPGAQVDLAGDLRGGASGAGELLRASPLRELTGGVFADWPFAGAVTGALDLTLLLGETRQPPRVELALDIEDLRTQLVQVNLPLSGIKGSFAYSSDTGFTGSRISGRALGGEFALAARESDAALELNLTGTLDVEALAQWLDLPMLAFATGTTSLGGTLAVPRKESATGDTWLRVSSDLRGVALDAPRPFGKTSAQPFPMTVEMPLRADPNIALSLGERLQVQLRLGDGALAQLAAAVGGAVPNLAACDSRYCLSGAVSALDIAAWQEFYARYLAPPVLEGATEAGPLAPPSLVHSYRVDSLKVGELTLASRRLGEARVDVWGAGDRWQGAIESAALQGSLTRQGEALQLLIEYLDVARFGAAEERGNSGGTPLTLADVQRVLPSMRVDILELRQRERVLGALGFYLDTSQDDQSLYASAIEGELWGLRLADPEPGLLHWAATGDGETTTLELDMGFDDLGAVLRAAGFAPTLESESGYASLGLHWPGPPTRFALTKSEGSISLTVRDGRILEARPGALAMVSFLNFAEILRGLSLTHMFEAGIPFLRADTELRLQQGMLEVVDLHIDGPASAFSFNGLSDIKARSIDGELLVTLPVANNLPWVAALAAGLPVAAGVFVVSKVFEKQVNRMSSAVYGVTGAIDAPKVEFRRLFDDKLSPTPEAPEADEKGGG